MRLWDRLTIEEFGLAGAILMENASRGALAVLEEVVGNLRGKRVVLFAGPGNNGGDGFALARHLTNIGATVLVLHAKPLENYSGDAKFHLSLLSRMEASCALLDEYERESLTCADIIVDALLGTGLRGPLQPQYERWIKTINRLAQRAFVLALDIPSGLCGRTGTPQPIAVQASVTVCFEEKKLGLAMPAAQPYLGTVYIKKIGIPRHIKEAHPTAHVAIGPEVWDYLPRPKADLHKGSAGHVLVVGGSPGLTGAPLLAARGAYRAGAGLVTWAAPAPLLSHGAPFPETMTLSVGPNWGAAAAQTLAPHLERFGAVVLGPGLGRTSEAGAFLQTYLHAPHPHTVFDADALWHLASQPQLLNLLPPQAILTPHPGEMARLLGSSLESVCAHRLDAAQTWRTRSPSHLILKGAATLVVSPQCPIAVSPWCCPNLAVAGSGDVLAGVLGALLAQGLPSHHAAVLAVYWHGAAGAHLAQTFPYRGNTPLDIAETLPLVPQE